MFKKVQCKVQFVLCFLWWKKFVVRSYCVINLNGNVQCSSSSSIIIKLMYTVMELTIAVHISDSVDWYIW